MPSRAAYGSLRAESGRAPVFRVQVQRRLERSGVVDAEIGQGS